MQLRNNLAIIAAAGSRKTQHIVDSVHSNSAQRVLVTTYTNENLRQITDRLGSGGLVPVHATVMGWFTFLLNQCARPYQNAVLGEVGLMRSLDFKGQRPRSASKKLPRKYYLNSRYDVYRDEVAALAYEGDQRSGGKVIGRLAEIYDHIYIDEVQDLAGYDLKFLDLIMQSPIGLTVVGDPRQATYATNNSRMNSRYKGSGIAAWLEERAGYCTIEPRMVSYRCNQDICDFADGLYPELPRTLSKNTELTGHDGIFDITQSEVHAYVEKYSPLILRHNKRVDTVGLDAMNIGVSKGSTFDRVLIFPTQPMIQYFRKRDPGKAGDRSKLYVAVTRAKYSATFVIP